MASSPTILRSNPGIKRDGTRFDGEFYTDGQWVRFQRGLPRKIGGYRAISKYLTEMSSGFAAYTQQGYQYCHSGSESLLERFTIDGNGNCSVISDRTPSTLVSDDKNMWMFDYQFDGASLDNYIIAHVAPNQSCICNDVGGQIFYGVITDTAALTEITLPAASNATGGVVVLHPYLVYYGSDGIIGWSVPGEPTDLSGSGSGTARPWGQKFIKGMPLRAGAGSAPAGVFWAYDAVIRASFSGGATVFQFDTIATGTSIMSPNCVVDYDGVFYWVGVDRFMMFNGVVREVENVMNINYFFDNLQVHNRSKVFGFKVPRFGEIWWCYPKGDAEYCTHAIIYNVRENSWYDTALPEDGRTAGVFNNGLASPILTGAIPTESGYRVWLHEKGVDAIDGISVLPVQSRFTTADLSFLVKGQNNTIDISAIEPDFIQTGPMTAQVVGRANARAQEIAGPVMTYPEQASTPHEQIVMLKEQRRELRVTFESNAVGGDYQMGQIIAHIEAGDGTMLG